MLVHVGRIWSDGDPFLLLDEADAPAWAPSQDDYVREVVDRVSRRETSLGVGDGEAMILAHEAGEGTLEIFRVGERELLMIVVRYADEPAYQHLAESAALAKLRPIGAIDVRSGNAVFVRSASPWAEATIEREHDSETAPTDWGPVEQDALVVPMPTGRYAIHEGQVEEETYGLDVWRLAEEQPR